MTADQHRRRVRATAESLVPGNRVVPWNDRLTPYRTVAATYPVEHDHVLVEFTDHTVRRVHRWAVFHRTS